MIYIMYVYEHSQKLAPFLYQNVVDKCWLTMTCG